MMSKKGGYCYACFRRTSACGCVGLFETLCAIPHGSRDTKAISDYCVRFAQERGLSWQQDASNNVIIRKPASPGYEDHPTVILQGHLDMVCEKDANCDIDFSKDGLRLRHDDTYIFADGTTLGGDDGIAVAYALAVLDSSELKHPPLEAVFTVDEEIGMLGAAALDMSGLQGRVLLNIDSEDEGILTVSCAGGATSCLTVPVKRVPVQGNAWRVGVRGLTGGHSGVEINKGRANANKVLAAALQGLPVTLCSIAGGSKDNAIPRASEAVVVSEADDFAALFAANAGQGRPAGDGAACGILLRACRGGRDAGRERGRAWLLNAVPNGVQAMSSDIPGLVQTSLNLGILTTDADAVRLTFSVRSSVNREKFGLIDQLKALAARFGGSYSETGEYLHGSTRRIPACARSWSRCSRPSTAASRSWRLSMPVWSAVFSPTACPVWTPFRSARRCMTSTRRARSSTSPRRRGRGSISWRCWSACDEGF